MPSNVIILAATAAALFPFSISGNRAFSLSAVGLSGDEVVTLEHEVGGLWEPVEYDGTVQELTASTNRILVQGAGSFRVNKSVTVAAVPVALDGGNAPTL